MTHANWTALAESCERAIGPDRRLDGEIAKALGWTTKPHETELLRWYSPSGMHYGAVPTYTGSIDEINEVTDFRFEGASISILRTTKRTFATLRRGYVDVTGVGKTEALARCASLCWAQAEVDRSEKQEAIYD